MAESEFLCVRVATFLRNKKTCKHTKSDVTRRSMLSKLSGFYFNAINIGLTITTAQAKKKHRHSSGNNLGRDNMKS